MKKNYNSLIADCLRKKFGSRSILHIRHLSEMTGNINSGVFLSQLLYWWEKGSKEGWIYKTVREIRDETGLTKDQQKTAIKIWADAGIIKLKLEGIPPKRHFQINIEKLVNFLDIKDTFDEETKDL